MITRIPVLLLLWFAAAQSLAENSGPARVVVMPVQELGIGQPYTATGVVQSRNDILIAATVEGELGWVAEQGSQVKADELIARIDDRALKLRRGELQLLADRSRIEPAYHQREMDRLSELRKSSLASETMLAEVESKRNLSENQLRIAEARVAQLDERLARTRILAPVSGVVAERLRQTGEYARISEPLIRLVDTQNLEVRVAVPMTYLNRVKAGSALTVGIENLSFNGNVRMLVLAGNEASQTFDILVDLPRAAASSVLAGQFADVNLPVPQNNLSLVVPRDAVVLRSDGIYVFRIDESNKANRVAVVLGEGQGSLVSISGALVAGDQVAIRGVERLKDGDAVQPAS